MQPERSEVQWGSTSIPYLIRRSARRGTVSIAVEPSGAVVLTAPASTPIGRLDGVVRKKAKWIVTRVRRRSDLPRAGKREFVSGESELYLGRSYRLRVVHSQKPAAARLERGLLVVPAVAREGTAERVSDVRAALVAWYKRHAALRLPERAQEWAEELRLDPPQVLVREQRQRWGSCDASGVVRLNWRIIQAPTSLIDYVIAHELVHLVHREHDPAFWATLGKAMPDYEERKRRLLELGPRLVW